MNLSLSLSVADRFVHALEGLYRAVAARSARGVLGEAPLATALILVVCHRVRRVEGRILRMLARFQAGRLRVRDTVRGGNGTAVTVRSFTRVMRAEARLPRGQAWLLPMVPSAAASFASQLRVVLAEPEMVALLAASAQARRVLAPVCRMLGIEAAVLTPAALPPVSESPSAPGSAKLPESDIPMPMENRVTGPAQPGPGPGPGPAARAGPS